MKIHAMRLKPGQDLKTVMSKKKIFRQVLF